MSKLLPVIGVAVLAYLISIYLFGLAALGAISISAISFVVATLALLKWRGVSYAQGWFFSKKTNMYLGGILMVWLVVGGTLGFIPGMIPSIDSVLGVFSAASLTSVTEPSTTVQAGCAVSPELLGKEAALQSHTYDMEANNPYSAEVDLTSTCYLYKNGNGPENFVGTTSDTSDAAQSTGFSVGDTMNVYCGGSSTSYYAEKIENLCIDSQDDSFVISAHAMAAETEIALTGYDETGATGLTAAGNTSTADYDLTLGASEEKSVYVQVKTNVANSAINFIGFATSATNDIDSVKPTDSAFVEQTGVAFLDKVDASANSDDANANQTITYDAYIMSSPILLSEWDFKKYQFTVKATSTDPTATDNVFSTIDAGVICTLDATYVKGDDGKPHLGYHDFAADSESNVGIAETFKFPVGKNSCLVLEGN